MAEPIHRPILNACRTWLRPIARWLLKSGVTWEDFAELSRAEFVAVASEEFGLRGRPTNVSRVALLTGMTRREVRRYREAPRVVSPVAADELNHASRVLAGWHLDPDFIDERGRPRELPAAGEEASFAALVRRYAGDIPSTALVKELVKSGSIERTATGGYRVLRRYYMPRPMDGQAVERAGSVLADLVSTVEHNLAQSSMRRAGPLRGARAEPPGRSTSSARVSRVHGTRGAGLSRTLRRLAQHA